MTVEGGSKNDLIWSPLPLLLFSNREGQGGEDWPGRGRIVMTQFFLLLLLFFFGGGGEKTEIQWTKLQGWQKTFLMRVHYTRGVLSLIRKERKNFRPLKVELFRFDKKGNNFIVWVPDRDGGAASVDYFPEYYVVVREHTLTVLANKQKIQSTNSVYGAMRSGLEFSLLFPPPPLIPPFSWWHLCFIAANSHYRRPEKKKTRGEETKSLSRESKHPVFRKFRMLFTVSDPYDWKFFFLRTRLYGINK